MKIIAIALAAFVFISTLFTGIFTKKSRNSPGKVYTFSYYPEVNVYYDHSRKNLLYTLDGGKSWTKIPRHQDSLPATLGKVMTFQSTVAEGWTQNVAHRATYSGVNTDFTVEPIAIRESANEIEKFDTKNNFIAAETKKKRSKPEGKRGKDNWLKDLKERIKKVGAKFKKEK